MQASKIMFLETDITSHFCGESEKADVVIMSMMNYDHDDYLIFLATVRLTGFHKTNIISRYI